MLSSIAQNPGQVPVQSAIELILLACIFVQVQHPTVVLSTIWSIGIENAFAGYIGLIANKNHLSRSHLIVDGDRSCMPSSAAIHSSRK
jgi:hypothetical protein